MIYVERRDRMTGLKVLLKIGAALIPSTILFILLMKFYFPNGMAIMFILPLIYVLNIGTIGLGFLAVHLSNQRYKVWIWLGVFVVTLVIMIWAYPQEGRDNRHVVYKIWDTINGHYDKSWGL